MKTVSLDLETGILAEARPVVAVADHLLVEVRRRVAYTDAIGKKPLTASAKAAQVR
ncbi:MULTISPECIES: hypothetical protein [unclassified Variovorax]|uniref:hypothetical protein n=1 Tax=unclassified Variovorax TaxID=663243 RepID=UPI003F45E409